tara:strand:- start:3620 stop:3769 length:150 start_codon:yes stop_codon:yes gene_type:complete
LSSYDSRSFGAACCAGCDEDLCDDAAGLGLILCGECQEKMMNITSGVVE